MRTSLNFVFYRTSKVAADQSSRQSGFPRPCGVEFNGVRLPLYDSAARMVLGLFCNPFLTTEEMMELRWPDPDTMPDQWASCLATEICNLNKRLATVGVRIMYVRSYYIYRMIDLPLKINPHASNP